MICAFTIALAALGSTDGSAGSPAEAFWARDLAALHAQLRDPAAPPSAPHSALFDDLLALATCERLPPLEEGGPDEDLRLLVRAEAARRAALGPAVDETIWRDLLRPGFFRLGDPPREDDVLRWPLETEVWDDERTHLDPPRWSCRAADAQPAPAEPIDPVLLERLAQSGDAALRSAGARLAYLRTASLLGAGDAAAAQKAASLIDVAAIDPPLRFWARLARRLTGASAEPWQSLVDDAPEPLAQPLRERACHEAFARRDFEAALKAAAGGASGSYLAVCEAAARVELGEAERAIAALTAGDDGKRGPLRRRLVVDALVAAPASRREAIARDLPTHERTAIVADAARAAIDRNRREDALALARLARGASSHREDMAVAAALDAELAWAAGDRERFAAAIDLLIDDGDERFATRRQREVRDREMLTLLRRLASAAGTGPAPLREVFERFEIAAGTRARRELEPLRPLVAPDPVAAEEDEDEPEAPVRRARAAGRVAVEAPRSLPAPGDLQVEWPPPHSLLLIPGKDGRLRAWFDQEVADGS